MGTWFKFVFISNYLWTLDLLAVFQAMHIKAVTWNCVHNLKSNEKRPDIMRISDYKGNSGWKQLYATPHMQAVII